MQIIRVREYGCNTAPPIIEVYEKCRQYGYGKKLRYNCSAYSYWVLCMLESLGGFRCTKLANPTSVLTGFQALSGLLCHFCLYSQAYKICGDVAAGLSSSTACAEFLSCCSTTFLSLTQAWPTQHLYGHQQLGDTFSSSVRSLRSAVSRLPLTIPYARLGIK